MKRRHRLLARASRRFLLQHPWQFGLSLLGVALGVAVTAAVGLANSSALRAFELSSEALTGPATHQIVAGDLGFDERVFVDLRLELGQRRSAPVVSGWVVPAVQPSRSLLVVGIDPVSELSMRRFRGVAESRATLPGDDLGALIGSRGAALLAASTGQALGLAPGDSFEVHQGARGTKTLQVLGLWGADEARGLADTVLVDIATAQELLGWEGRLSRIDLVLEGAEDAAALRSALPDTVALLPAQARADSIVEMTRAFRLNLRAMSLLALLCGLFLIYNTMTFSVVQRRELFGGLRALGVTRTQILRLVLTEGLVVGGSGTALGLLGGIVMARGLVRLVTRTINDLYFAVQVDEVTLALPTLLASVAVGVVGTLAASLVPALEATHTTPRLAMTRSSVETAVSRRLPRLSAAGLVGIAAGAAVISATQDLLVTFAGLFTAVIGAALVTPAATLVLGRIARRPLRSLLGAPGNLAARGVTGGLSRTSVAVAALMIAVSLIIGVSVMVSSFRTTLVRWLEHTLSADLYVAPAGPSSVGYLALDEGTIERLLADPEVRRVGTVRGRQLESDTGRTQLLVIGASGDVAEGFRLRSELPEPWERFARGDVMVSEPYAHRTGVLPGDSVVLPTDRGPHSFVVAGVYYSYASDRGLVMIERGVYQRWWDDRRYDGLSVGSVEGADLARLGDRVRDALGDEQPLQVISNREIRERSLVVFDRTFLITTVLRSLVAAVAFVGVLGALMALQFERRRELGMLRAAGMTPRQLWRMVLTQTGLLGVIAGLLALPLGLALAWVMIFVINRRSFGWTLLMEVPGAVLWQAFLVAVAAALLAGILPAARAARAVPAGILREE